MNRMSWSVAALAVVVALATGWWMGRSTAPEGAAAVDVASAAAEREVLYYRNPMGLPDTSPVPKKDPMGMDYIPVYASDEPVSDAGTVALSPGKIQTLGVRT